MSVIEEWRDVKGYEGKYKVSSLGQVSCVETGELLFVSAAEDTPTVYLNTGKLDKHGRSKILSKRVHLLMAEAFLGYCRQGYVRWRDGDKYNIALSNIYLDATRGPYKATAKMDIKIGKKPCSKCNRMFMPEHKFNRICSTCKISEEWRKYGYYS